MPEVYFQGRALQKAVGRMEATAFDAQPTLHPTTTAALGWGDERKGGRVLLKLESGVKLGQTLRGLNQHLSHAGLE